jgi:hypothetical protein
VKKCEQRIDAEKLAASNEVARVQSEAKINEQHALKVQEIQMVSQLALACVLCLRGRQLPCACCHSAS